MKDPIIVEYEKLKRSLMFEQVGKAIKDKPNNWKQELETLGFMWCEEEQEITDENQQEPVVANQNQQYLVDYLEGKVELSETIVQAWISELTAESPNYDLFHKYFRSGNQYLKQLLLLAINTEPANRDLLLALAYFHENTDIIAKLLDSYTNTFTLENDLEKFELLVKDFLFTGCLDEEDTFEFLTASVFTSTEKLMIVERMISEFQSLEEDIEF